MPINIPFIEFQKKQEGINFGCQQGLWVCRIREICFWNIFFFFLHKIKRGIINFLRDMAVFRNDFIICGNFRVMLLLREHWNEFPLPLILLKSNQAPSKAPKAKQKNQAKEPPR